MKRFLFHLSNKTVHLVRELMRFFRQRRIEFVDALKMSINYGFIARFIYKIKIMYFSLFTKNYNPSKLLSYMRLKHTNNKIKLYNYHFPDDLSIKLKKIEKMNKIENLFFKSSFKLIFISPSLPYFDKKSSHLRVFNIIKILLKAKCKIEFIYLKEEYYHKKYTHVYKGPVNFRYLPLSLQDYVKLIIEHNPDYVWITNLWTVDYFEFIIGLMSILKQKNAGLNIIVDTMDFHFKKHLRKYEQSMNIDDLAVANKFLEFEKILYRVASSVVVVSDEEKNDILEKIGKIDEIVTVPNIHEVPIYIRPYSKRRNICFVGNFSVTHNVDAVRHFLSNIFRLILKENPCIEFHIIGESSRKYKKEFSSVNVRVIGRLNNLDEALSHYKLFVCPMTYGAGMKGKIGSAIAAGVPIVTSSVGAEGFPVKDGEECLISDSPIEFAEKCNLCLRDPIVWHKLSAKSRLMLSENYSPSVVARKLANALAK